MADHALAGRVVVLLEHRGSRHLDPVAEVPITAGIVDADACPPVIAVRHRLQTPEGKRLYALRKQSPEPVFGIIKSIMGFRQFLLRGIDKVQGEWNLVTLAWNMKRMYALAAA